MYKIIKHEHNQQNELIENELLKICSFDHDVSKVAPSLGTSTFINAKMQGFCSSKKILFCLYGFTRPLNY